MEEARKTLLDNLSHQKCVDLIPMYVYVAVLMVAGLVGNILVCRFYTTRGRATPTTRLIVALAIIDAIVCVLMPKNIAIMCLSLNGYGNWPCKLNVYFNHVTVVSSMFVLVAIAIFRFRAVCRPFSRQFTLRHTNIVIISLVLLSMTITMPTLFTYKAVIIDVKLNANETATGFNCQFSNDPAQMVLVLAVNGILFFAFVMSLLIIFVMYSLIGIKILKQHRKRIRLFARPVNVSADGIIMSEASAEFTNIVAEKSGCESEVAMGPEKPTFVNRFDRRDVKNDSDKASAEQKPNEKGEEILPYDKKEHSTATASRMKNTSTKPVASISTGGNEKTEHLNVSDPQMNGTFAIPTVVIRQVLMLFVITVVLIISLLPYFVISISEAISERAGEDKYTNWFQFCSRSYLINSAVNPFIYGFFNTEFRHFVKNRFFCR